MHKPTLIVNPYGMPVGGQVIEFRGMKPWRIRLDTGLTLRMSERTGLYVPED